MILNNKTALLILTNSFSNDVKELYINITKELRDTVDTYLLYHLQVPELPENIKNYTHHFFNDEILSNLGYLPLTNSLLPGSNHFPLFDFYLKHHDYDHYWLVEDDVRFNGNWQQLLNAFGIKNQSDFISSHIEEFFKIPNWHWWITLTNSKYYVPMYSRLRSFNPIYRISNTGLSFLHDCLLNGWVGHHEVLLPTLLFLEGFRLLDFGGKGTFVKKKFENKYYQKGIPNLRGELSDGSMRFRPVCNKDEMHFPILYHPIKPQ